MRGLAARAPWSGYARATTCIAGCVAGVSVNYHGLADFRSGHGELLDQLLTHNIATLAAGGVIALAEVVQDGVRASAGAASFRREQKKARRLIERLKRELDEDPDASNRRIRAARSARRASSG